MDGWCDRQNAIRLPPTFTGRALTFLVGMVLKGEPTKLFPFIQGFNSFLASSDFCCLLITFANSLDPDQDQQNVQPDLEPNRLTLLIVFLK